MQAHHPVQHRAHAALHFQGGAAREGQQQHALGIGAVQDQMGHAVGKRIGLARTGAGDHQQRAVLAAALPGAGRATPNSTAARWAGLRSARDRDGPAALMKTGIAYRTWAGNGNSPMRARGPEGGTGLGAHRPDNCSYIQLS